LKKNIQKINKIHVIRRRLQITYSYKLRYEKIYSKSYVQKKIDILDFYFLILLQNNEVIHKKFKWFKNLQIYGDKISPKKL